jgi:glucuronokinase
MPVIPAFAYPRAGLLGNPSDLYGGMGIGFCLSNWSVQLQLDSDRSPGDEIDLLRAARRMLAQEFPKLAEELLAGNGFRLEFQSDIPRQVGLSGSSAIVLAALRAMNQHLKLDLTCGDLGQLAWHAEAFELGITAGPMDRQIQTFEGLLWMDFARGRVQRLTDLALPPMRILIDPEPGQESGGVHAPVRERWKNGEMGVRTTMAAFRPLVERGLRALRLGDFDDLRVCVDHNFDLRASLFPIAERDRCMIELARQYGAAAKFCGSGGAVLVLPGPETELEMFEQQAVESGFHCIVPQVITEPSS